MLACGEGECGGWSGMNPLALGTFSKMVPIPAGKIAANCKGPLTSIESLDSLTEFRLHGLLPSCDGGCPFAGVSECP
jgi:hypothetical protein